MATMEELEKELMLLKIENEKTRKENMEETKVLREMIFDIIKSQGVTAKESIRVEDNTLTWKDKDTGLIWEMKNEENIEDAYTWEEAFSYAEELNEMNYGGFNDWRVPTINELKTLVTEEKINDFFIKSL